MKSSKNTSNVSPGQVYDFTSSIMTDRLTIVRHDARNVYFKTTRTGNIVYTRAHEEWKFWVDNNMVRLDKINEFNKLLDTYYGDIS